MEKVDHGGILHSCEEEKSLHHDESRPPAVLSQLYMVEATGCANCLCNWESETTYQRPN